jgi:glutathione peroxidase
MQGYAQAMRVHIAAVVLTSALAVAGPVAAAPAAAGPVVPAAERGAPVLSGTYGRLTGGRINLASLRGRVVMVVNTASHCGFTSQYTALEALWKARRARGVTVLGVPSRDFKQELPTNGQVARFCKLNFGVTFPMLRVSKVTGRTAIPLMRGVAAPSWSQQPDWNFNKYLLDRQGRVAMRFPSATTPDAPEVTRAIATLLAERT